MSGSTAPFLGFGGPVGAPAWGAPLLLGWPAGGLLSNVTTFAREMAMARTSLFTKLKAITGQTPNDFILSIRLKRGAYLLRNNLELNISEISDKIGFSTPKYFRKCFKDMYQVSPLAYRQGEDEGETAEEEEGD